MHIELERLSSPELRNLLLHEARTFVTALGLGSTMTELADIRTRIRTAADLLHAREKREAVKDGEQIPEVSDPEFLDIIAEK